MGRPPSLLPQEIRDDTLFDAALVSFGSFGVIHGLMIEARELFLLHAFRSWRPLDAALQSAIADLDFSGLDLHGQPASALHHFQVTVNPNEGQPPATVAVYLMFERPWTEAYEPPPWDEASAGPGASGLEILGALYDRLPTRLGRALRPILNEQVRGHLGPYELTAPIKDLFGGEHTLGPVFASAVGVPAARAVEALTAALDVYARLGAVIPVLLTMRFVPATPALLGFTRFAPTCVLEVDGLNNRRTHEYATRVWTALEQASIPFTMHWGKFNGFLTPERIRRMYGDGARRWIESREALLQGPDVRKVFTNDFLRSVGLAT